MNGTRSVSDPFADALHRVIKRARERGEPESIISLMRPERGPEGVVDAIATAFLAATVPVFGADTVASSFIRSERKT